MDNRQTRIQECIFDATMVMTFLQDKEWWPKDTDSRNIFFEIQDIAKFYEDHYPEDDPDYLTNIEYLTEAWFSQWVGLTLTNFLDSFLWKNQRIAKAIRENIDTGDDYDFGVNAEQILGREITMAEYSKLAAAVEPDLMGMNKSDKAKLEEILNPPKKRWTIKIRQVAIINFEAEVEAATEQEAIEEFDRRNGNDEFSENWADANDYADITDENMTIEEMEDC